jgi:hypothetical protein
MLESERRVHRVGAGREAGRREVLIKESCCLLWERMSLDESAAFWDSVRENILIQSVVTVLSYEAAILWRQASRNSGIEQARSGEVRYQSELNKTDAGVLYAVDAHGNTCFGRR